jgi:spore maturation protein CgeB
MKIIIVAPKTITKHKQTNEAFRYDLSFWNFLFPLQAIGHQAYFFDTSQYGDKELQLLIEREKPDLLFCIMTGDQGYCPYEPWETILNETQKGRLKTFNWFCDDTWRFEKFSMEACKHFHACTTPEKQYVEKYKEAGYDNIRYATWHANSDIYTGLRAPKKNDITFIGAPRGDRQFFIDALKTEGMDVNNPINVSLEDMVWAYSDSKIGLNFSKNPANNDTQMKQRMFEIPAAGSMLLTEYHENLENCYDIDKEIVTFRTTDELIEKLKFLLQRPKLVDTITESGHKRFLREHESRIRLKGVTEWIQKL